MATPVNMPQSGTVPTPVPQSAPTDADINDLASQIRSMVDAASAGAVALSQATIAATALTAAPPTVSILLSGSTTQIDGVSFFDGYTPAVGDNVDVLKQGNTVVVIGHVADQGTGTASSGGWVNPTLSSGFTTVGNSNAPLAVRVISQGGVWKVQWTGSVAHTGSNTTVIAAGVLATNFRPANKVSMLAARDIGSGTHQVGVDFKTDGSVSLVAPTVTAAHLHSLGTSDVQLSGYLSQAGSDLGHAHGLGSSTGTTSSVNDPSWISFNGIEYFL